MAVSDEEEKLLRSVALQNASSIHQARHAPRRALRKPRRSWKPKRRNWPNRCP